MLAVEKNSLNMCRTGSDFRNVRGCRDKTLQMSFQLMTQPKQRCWASYRIAEDSPQSTGDSRHLEGNSPQSSPQLIEDSRQLTPNPPHLPTELLSLAETTCPKVRRNTTKPMPTLCKPYPSA